MHVEVNALDLLKSKNSNIPAFLWTVRENQTRHKKGSKFPVHVRSSRSVLEAPGTLKKNAEIRIHVFSYKRESLFNSSPRARNCFPPRGGPIVSPFTVASALISGQAIRNASIASAMRLRILRVLLSSCQSCSSRLDQGMQLVDIAP
jgi:hypothetical protein